MFKKVNLIDENKFTPYVPRNSEENNYDNIYDNKMSFYKDKNKKKKMCSIHSEESVRFFCLDCRNCCFCNYCYLEKKHESHNILTIEDAWKKIKNEELSVKMRNKVKDMLSHARNGNDIILNLHNDVLVSLNDSKCKIESYLGEIVEIIQEKKINQLSMLSETFSRYQTEIRENQDKLKLCYDNLDDLKKKYESYKLIFNSIELSKTYHGILKEKSQGLNLLLDSDYLKPYHEQTNLFKRKLDNAIKDVYIMITFMKNTIEAFSNNITLSPMKSNHNVVKNTSESTNQALLDKLLVLKKKDTN